MNGDPHFVEAVEWRQAAPGGGSQAQVFRLGVSGFARGFRGIKCCHHWNTPNEIEGRSPSDEEATSIFEHMREYNSGILRTNAPRSVLTNNVEQELDALFRQWVAPIGSGARRVIAARDPLGGLRREARSILVKLFREGYGAPLNRRKFQRRYEVKGVAHINVIDLAMIDRANKREHLFHHVLLLPDAEESFNQAAGLSCRWVDITAQNHVRRDLTAVLYKRHGQPSKGVEEATDLLKESNIGVAKLEDVPRLAAKLKSQPDFAL